MDNPFELILARLNELESKIDNIKIENNHPEIIDRIELCKRLAITQPTVIRWEKRGSIPFLRIGSSVRYNWPSVVKALESNK